MSFNKNPISFSDMVAMDVSFVASSVKIHQDEDEDMLSQSFAPKSLSFDSPNSSFDLTGQASGLMEVDHAGESSSSEPSSPIDLGLKKLATIPRGSRGRVAKKPQKHLSNKNLIIAQKERLELSCKKASPLEQEQPQLTVRRRGMIGDGSKTNLLPSVRGFHQDLVYISCRTLSLVIKKSAPFEAIKNLWIVDCRYPYEFEGGHIRGAMNVHNRQDLKGALLGDSSKSSNSSERHIVIFHCEFSSERGPGLARFLRNEDRRKNQERYPFLDYPEIYVLEGGYKAFFESCKDLCHPPSYKAMLADGHEAEMRSFKTNAKRSHDADKPETMPKTSVRRFI